MQPVQDLLNRIRWDKNFSDANFEVGYYDRIKDTLIMVPFQDIDFPPENHFAFELLDNDGNVHCIPYHRIRQITRNGQCIWRRTIH